MTTSKPVASQAPADAHNEDDDGFSGSQSFQELGVDAAICEAIAAVGWSQPSKIQQQAIPHGLAGKDIIGLAETGSGKTGAFVIPILQSLLQNPQRLYALVLAPTRELAYQIGEQFEALGASIGLKCACVVGGIDMMQQQVALARKPHVVIATPGRLVDHLENTKGFSLRTIKFLVLDEADRMLSMDFEEEINQIVQLMPAERNTYLFSATMTSKVRKLQRASLKDPVKVEITHKFATPETLKQHYLFIPAKFKDCYLAYLLNEVAGQSVLIFASTCNGTQKVTLMLRNLGFQAICLHGQMPQPSRLGALNKFKAKARNVLVCTDVASRGLDIPSVDVVINYDIPTHGKDYIHRVGRTARAGRAGVAISFVTQYDVELYQRIEHLLGTKLDAYPCEEDTVLVMSERVNEAQRIATIEMKEAAANGTGVKRGRYGKDEGDEEEEDGEKRYKSASRVQKGGRGGGRGDRGRGGRGRGSRGRGGRGKRN
ncbi:putative ATP-dependent RNA helicase [Phytophthora fragariae]|uniref:Putative ATP-dependent RNA helicase n=1 Tax=Phytophthora fragariae TaxID=53985 RepID=A0A6A3LQW3_9STRA|nr:putative ATP-dependent RNA helicase [Phytophthora fragariae]KAE8943980.1 putative ATP-dependent RNA helicase [Phytophthora fragariae]KAE9021619.1 putative ATP-dependent RNA helicase [Phytophthora fragariae]KAE9109575.1 putative ATP-dependent RNA helicase [Phytophthora fragariae]KAE9126948.1 putative ATP-dependent RNA helicase [Phytophthora fragariae]